MRTRHDRWWNFFSIILLFFALILTSLKLQSTEWTENLGLLNLLTVISFILGIGLGYSKFNSFIVSIMITIYSVFFLPWTIGITYDSTIDWISRLENIFSRILFSTRQLGMNVQIEDPIIIYSLLAFVIWFTSLFAGYFLVRESKPWFPLFISAIIIFTTEIYDQSNSNLYTGLFIFFTLLLISKTSFMEIGKKWRFQRIPIDLETESLIRRTSIIVAIIIVFLSWNVTNIVSAFQKDSVQNKQLVGAIAEIQSQISKITAPLQGTAYIQTEFYGDTVNLGTGSDLNDEIIFEIKVNQRQPSGVRYYWKGKSYDTFTNNQWESTLNASKVFGSNDPLNQTPEMSTFTKRTFSIKTLKNLGVLYSPTYPQSINRPIKANYQILPNDQVDIVSLTLEKVTFSGEVYEVENIILNPTIAQLRKTNQEYPDWVKEKYLQLPSNFSGKIFTLADELTKDQTNPYDKTIEITNYLRDNITYQEQIPEPPADQDIIEWFLFKHKQGFCNYYATAEVLMLRSIGIPARISFGYAEGDAQNTIGTDYIVRRENLHAWPEVYFQGIGWVEFEPTTIQPIINRLQGESFNDNTNIPIIRDPTREDLPIMDGGETIPEENVVPELVVEPIEMEVEEIEETTPTFRNFYVFLLTIGLILTFFLLRNTSKNHLNSAPVILESYFSKRGWKSPNWLKLWAFYSKLSAEEKAFSKIIWSLFLFQKEYAFSLTPSEIVAKYNDIFPEMREISSSTLLEYQQAVYSNHPIDIKSIQEKTNKIFRYSLTQKFLSILRRKKHYQSN